MADAPLERRPSGKTRSSHRTLARTGVPENTEQVNKGLTLEIRKDYYVVRLQHSLYCGIM